MDVFECMTCGNVTESKERPKSCSRCGKFDLERGRSNTGCDPILSGPELAKAAREGAIKAREVGQYDEASFLEEMANRVDQGCYGTSDFRGMVMAS